MELGAGLTVNCGLDVKPTSLKCRSFISNHILQMQKLAPEERKELLSLSFKDQVLATDKSVHKFTGMLTKKLLLGIFNIIDKNVTINYWRGPNKNIESKSKQKTCGRSLKITKFDQYLMTIIHIRQGASLSWLSPLFNLSESSASVTIITWVDVLYRVFKNWLIWPSADQVKKHLPTSYPEQYRDTRVILDCTEFYTVKPSNCSAQAATYSLYKHHNTVKALIGITPTGLITFVSDVYGGNTSDRFITEHEFLHKVEPGDALWLIGAST